MEDILQPSDESYAIGDQVRIYIGSDDLDSQYHGVVCEIIEIITDDLDAETGRITDSYSYTVRNAETGEEPPMSVQHHDLVPHEDVE